MEKIASSPLRRFSYTLLICTVCWNAQVGAETSCSSDSQEIFTRATQAQQGGNVQQARNLYRQAAILCGKASYWQALGDVLAAGATEGTSEEALEAFANAFDAARREKNKPAGGVAARAIAREGLKAGDPIKANSWLVLARQLDPDHGEIPVLEKKVDLAMADLSTEEIEIGFSNTRGAGKANRLLHGNPAATNYWKEQPKAEDPTVSSLEVDPLDTSAGGAGSQTPEAVNAPQNAPISIPIRFESNSSEVTAATASNIKNLASVLAAKPPETQVTLLGHADVRGDADYNLYLSQQRANSIQEVLESLQPSLRGRVSSVGRGESEPVDAGTSKRAHASNRRLEIILSE